MEPSLESVTTINKDGSRRFIHPASVHGFFSRWRALAGVVLLAIYASLPWIPIKGHPAVFFDIANRQFHLFGLTFVTQDLWLAFFLVTGLGFTLFYVTSLLGRIWCGWACPQTVFLDVVRRIERWFEGDAPSRRRLDAMPWNLEKTFRRGLKNLVFAGFALALAHMFLSYYVSLPGLWKMMRHAPGENWNAFVFVFAMSAALWFNFTWFREQFCIVLCPYGRIQSALTDEHTMVIGYDSRRGEPRGKKGTDGAGDCVDCLRCVQVCPTGIDIRQGLQIECIGCAACIDACDSVMDKLERPRGLIRYDSQRGLSGQRTRWIRPRILLYTALLLLGVSVMTVSLSTLKPASVAFTRIVGAPYFIEGDTVRNQFLLRILNKHPHDDVFTVRVLDAPEGLRLTGAEDGIPVGALGESLRPLVLTLPKASAKGEVLLRIQVEAKDGTALIVKTVPFLGPGY